VPLHAVANHTRVLTVAGAGSRKCADKAIVTPSLARRSKAMQGPRMRGRWNHAVAGISALLGLAAIVGSTTHAYATGRYYTEAQASAGETVFHAQCAICHGDALQGKAGPALAGALFLSVSQYQQLNADYLYRFMSKHMPLNAPGSLTKTQYLDALAYILKVNGYPSGRQPLTADDTRLAQIKIEPTGTSQQSQR